ncbi:MAG: PAS domain S-box protein, partial [Nitrospirota bacterium]
MNIALFFGYVLTLVLVISFFLWRGRKTSSGLLELDEKLRKLVEESHVGKFVLQGERLVYVNPWISRTLGYTRDEMLALPSVFALAHPDDLEKVRNSYLKLMSRETDRERVEVRGIKKDGGVLTFEILGIYCTYKGKPAIIGNVFDITERKIAEEKLRQALLCEQIARDEAETLNKALEESEERFKNALYESPFPLMMHAEGGEVVMISRSWADITGYTLQDIPTVAHWVDKAYEGEMKEKAFGIIYNMYETLDQRTK